jgi:hypothetical protein
VMGKQGSNVGGEDFEQEDLFEEPTEAVDAKTAAKRVLAEIVAQRAEAAQTEQDSDATEPTQAVETSGTAHIGVEARAAGIDARVEREAAEVNDAQSPVRLEGTAPVITPGSSAEGERQTRLARLAVVEADAKARIEADAPDKAARIEAAHKGANQSRLVLEAIEKDRKMSSLDLAYAKASADTAHAREKLEAAKAMIDADQNHPTVLHDALFQTAHRAYETYLKVQERLYKLKSRVARRPVEPEVDQPEPEAPAEEGGARVEWKQGNLIGSREEAILKAAQLAAEKKLRSKEL